MTRSVGSKPTLGVKILHHLHDRIRKDVCERAPTPATVFAEDKCAILINEIFSDNNQISNMDKQSMTDPL